ncbi:MAG: zinc-ribbon and DUF3426 domain-containing protein [Chromatiales bacterium]|nr:zinc-ribbon and DUF3426 domain-containing protein [Chromatiales bacterium]
MFTACPECETVFRIGPAELRRAGGRVRCGECGTAFDALATLSDAPPGEEGTPAEHERAETLEFDVPPERWSSFFDGDEQGRGPQEKIDLEAEISAEDWDELVSSLAPLEDPEESTNPVFVIESGEEPDEDDGEAEPEEEAFLEEFAATIDQPPAPERPYLVPPRSTLYADPEPPSGDEDDEDAGGETPASIREPILPASAAPLPGPVRPAAGKHRADEHDLATAGDDVAGREDSDLDQPFGPPPFAQNRETRQLRRRWPWILGSLLLALLLAGQWLHAQRDRVAADPVWGDSVRAAYAWLGQPLYPEWNLRAWEITGSEAIAGRTAPDALEVIAQLRLVDTTPAPLPYLRIAIRDRFDNVVGERLLPPFEYAQGAHEGLLPPGREVPVRVALVDPGIEAHGYVIDICLQRRRDGMVCQQDLPPFQR